MSSPGEQCTIKLNRRWSLLLSGIDFVIYIDGTEMGVMYSDSREKLYEVEPGKHSVRISASSYGSPPVSSESVELNLSSGAIVVMETGLLKRYLIGFMISVLAISYIYGAVIVPIMNNAFTQSILLLILFSLLTILYVKPGAVIYLKIRS